MVCNFFGKILVFELDDGSFLIELLLIIYYFEDKFLDGCLLGINVEKWVKVFNFEWIVEL